MRYSFPNSTWLRLGLLLAFICIAPLASAQIVKSAQSVEPPLLRVGETATLIIDLSGRDLMRGEPDIEIPPAAYLDRLNSGVEIRSDGRSTHNPGAGKARVIFTLKPRVALAGSYTIPQWKFSVNKKLIIVSPVTIRVVGKAATVINGTVIGGSDKDDIFARLEVKPENPVVGQKMLMIFQVYAKKNFIPPSKFVIDDTRVSGLTWERLPNSSAPPYTVISYRLQCVATSPGPLNVNPKAAIALQVVTTENRGFVRFQQRSNKPVDLYALDAPTVTVRALPEEGKPKGFSGGVGSYSFDAVASPLEVSVGEPITLKMQISCIDSDPEYVTPPEFPEISGFRSYEIKRNRDLDRDVAKNTGLHSLRNFEQVVTITDPSITEIPALDFSYFNPKKGTYEVISKGPFPVKVNPIEGAGLGAVAGPAVTIAGTRRVMDPNLVYLKTKTSAWKQLGASQWYLRPVALLGPLASIACFLVGAWFIRRRNALRGDVALARKREAPKAARAGITEAENALRAKDGTGFYNRIWECLTGFYGNQFNLGAGEVSYDRIKGPLEAGGVDIDHMQKLKGLFDACEAQRFGQAATGDQMHKHLDDLKAVLIACEKVKV